MPEASLRGPSGVCWNPGHAEDRSWLCSHTSPGTSPGAGLMPFRPGFQPCTTGWRNTTRSHGLPGSPGAPLPRLCAPRPPEGENERLGSGAAVLGGAGGGGATQGGARRGPARSSEGRGPAAVASGRQDNRRPASLGCPGRRSKPCRGAWGALPARSLQPLGPARKCPGRSSALAWPKERGSRTRVRKGFPGAGRRQLGAFPSHAPQRAGCALRGAALALPL